MKKYQLAACGGTFDVLHKGHKEFLKHIAQIAERFIIGLTSDAYVQQNKSQSGIQSFVHRKEHLTEFLRDQSVQNYEIVPIDDAYGPTITDEYPFDVIVVSEETVGGAEDINEKRKKLNLYVLPIEVFHIVHDDLKTPISSTRVRNGIVNRNGNVYYNSMWFEKTLVLPEMVRKEFKKPFGELITNFDAWISQQSLDMKKVITVGDETTRKFNEVQMDHSLSIIDFKIKRKVILKNLAALGFNGDEAVINLTSDPGTITPHLFSAIYEWFSSDRKRTVIIVDGEDDLAVLPVLLAAPLGFSVFYGQPNEGMVYVMITEEIKNTAFHLISKFETLRA